MASPELAIAKAALSASLFKADPASVSRQQVDGLFPLVDAAMAQCSRQNVQNSIAKFPSRIHPQSCKNWIVAHVASSPARCASLAKYLVALSRSAQTDAAAAARPSLKRKRLHILYLLSDALHHDARSGSRICADAWAPHLVTLMAAAASFDKCPKHKAKLENLISLWEERGFLAADTTSRLRDAVLHNGNIANDASQLDTSAASLKIAKEAPYTLPSFHGDSSMPWYDLPVGTWLPHLTPNSARPMVPDRIRPIQLAAGLAEPAVVSAVQKLLLRADRIYTHSAAADGDINELGERFEVGDDGEVLSADTYYGWSRPFCEKMKARRKQPIPHSDVSRDRSYSSSRSPESRGRRSGSFSPSRKRPRQYSSDSRSLSRSPTPPPRDRNRSRSSSPGYKRQQRSPPHTHSNANMPLPGNFGLPPPPPPAAGFPGQWPPPPPLPLPPLQHMSQGGGMPNWTPDPAVMSQMMAAWSSSQSLPPPPPPPPPAQGGCPQGGYNNGYQQNTYNNRRGGHSNNYRGRGGGGYDRGRGR